MFFNLITYLSRQKHLKVCFGTCMVDDSGVSYEKIQRKHLQSQIWRSLLLCEYQYQTKWNVSSFDISVSSLYNWMNKLGKIKFATEKVGESLRRRIPKHKNIEERVGKLTDVISSAVLWHKEEWLESCWNTTLISRSQQSNPL